MSEPTKEPGFPRPQPGDEFVVVQRASKYREEMLQPVRVRAVARFRITLEGPDGEDLPGMYQEFDIRTRSVWGSYNSDYPQRYSDFELHTAETLRWEDRKRAADAYLSEQRVHLWEMRGSLKKAIDADFIGFVNVLRRFEGLEEI